jgi:hypothetical protein
VCVWGGTYQWRSTKEHGLIHEHSGDSLRKVCIGLPATITAAVRASLAITLSVGFLI